MSAAVSIQEEHGERFVLYDDDGVFGVLDRAAPQIYFAESRERALAEVARANEIVALYPTTIPMRHLREMDGAWRDARGLPRLPEPEGRRLVIEGVPPVVEVGTPAEASPFLPADASEGVQPVPLPAPQAGSAVERTLAAAAEVAALDTLRLRVEDARADLARTQSLADEIGTLSAASQEPVAQLRAAFARLYGDHAPAAEEGFREVLRTEGTRRAVGLVLDDPRSLVPAPRPRIVAGGLEAREPAAEAASRVALVLARLDRVVEEGRRHAGVPAAVDGRDETALRDAVQARLRDLTPAHERTVRNALAYYQRAAGSFRSEQALRRECEALTPAEQAAVRGAVPDVEELLQPARTRARPPRLSGGPGL